MSSLRKGKGKRTGKPESSNGMIKIGSRDNSLGAATGSKRVLIIRNLCCINFI